MTMSSMLPPWSSSLSSSSSEKRMEGGPEVGGCPFLGTTRRRRALMNQLMICFCWTHSKRKGGSRQCLARRGESESESEMNERVWRRKENLVETGLGHEETFVLRGGIRIVPVGNEPLFEDGDNLLGKVAASLFGIRGDDDGGMRAWHRALDGLRGEHRNERKVIRAGLPKVCPRGRDLGVLCEVVEGSRALAKVRDGG